MTRLQLTTAALPARLIITRAPQPRTLWIASPPLPSFCTRPTTLLSASFLRPERKFWRIRILLSSKPKAPIAVVAINSLDGSDIESYAADLYKKWGIGSKATDRGVLILLAVKDHSYRIEVGYGLEPILPDGKVGGFGREAVPLLKQNDYAGALLLMTSRVANVLAQDAGVQLTGAQAEAPLQQQPSQPPSAFRILFIIFIILIVLFTPLRRLVFWWLLFGGRGGGSGGGW